MDAQPRVLVFHDEPQVVEMVRFALSHTRFEARAALTTNECVDLLKEWHPHVAILDLELATEGIIQAIGRRPDGGFAMPILALTRRGDLKTKLQAFDMGVDDIMAMPISPEELLARVVVLFRRTYGIELELRSMIQLKDITFDILNRRVTVGSSELHLTSLEQSLLYLLAGSQGQILSREQIMDALWGVDYVAESNIVDRHIRNLRSKLQNDWRKPRFIATVPGKGYRFLLTDGVAS